MVIDVPYFEQETLYTCGAASVRMFLSFYGTDKTEEEIAKQLKISPYNGCGLTVMVPFLNSKGLDVHRDWEFASIYWALQHLRTSIEKGIPVIGLVNRLVYNTLTPKMDIKTTWEGKTYSHHFIVVTGMNEEMVSINDPHKEIGISTISLENFVDAWYKSRFKGHMVHSN